MESSSFSLDTKHRRFRAFATHQTLAHPLLLILSLLGVLSSGLFLVAPSIAFIGAGVGVLGLLLFFFATTYLDYATRPHGKESSFTAQASFEVLRILRQAGGTKQKGAEPLVVIEGLIATRAGQDFFSRLLLEKDEVNQQFKAVADALSVRDIYIRAEQAAAATGETTIELEHMLYAFATAEANAPWLRSHDLQSEDVMFVTWWRRAWRLTERMERAWWRTERLLSSPGLGLSFAAGFTPLTDRFSRIPQGNLWDIVNEGREDLVDQLILTLARLRQSNVLLVGQPGVGRLGIIQELARRVRTQHAHPALVGSRVMYLHIGELVAQGASSAAQLTIVSQALSEIERAGNIIVVIDGLSNILAEEGENRLNLTEVLLPFFSSLTVRVVVIISGDEYHLRLKNNEELIHFFEVVQVPAASEAATLRSLARATRSIERQASIRIPYQTLEAIVQGTSGILQHIPYPERAFDVLEEALALASARRERILSPELIQQLITTKVGLPVTKLRQEERQSLLDLESRMHERLVNQRQAVAALSRAMIRARAGVRNQTRPIGTFLFLGPTGVGKTEAAKTLAATYFGADTYLSRLDMSEFQTVEGVGTLIGTGQHPVGRLTSLITDTPFTVLLLDEFEKAHKSVQQLFLQVFDEGRLTDARGVTVSFQHAIIIATSNAASPLIAAEAKDGVLPTGFTQQLQDYLITTGIFSPELLNRFDGVITFTPLSREHLEEVAQLMLAKLNSRLDSTHGVTVAVTPELIDYLLSIGYSPEFGARPLNRAIQDTVEYTVARRVVSGQTKPGEVLTLSPALLDSERDR